MKEYQDYVKEFVLGMKFGKKARYQTRASICYNLLGREEREHLREKLRLTSETREKEIKLPFLNNMPFPSLLNHIQSEQHEEVTELILEIFKEASLNVKEIPEFDHSLTRIASFIGLDEVTTTTLAYLFILEQEEVFEDMVSERNRRNYLIKNFEVISPHRNEVLQALSVNGFLIKGGLLNFNRYTTELAPQVSEFLMGSGNENFHDKYVSTGPKEVLPLEYFKCDKKELHYLKKLLLTSKSLHMLFIGIPGSGKTSFSLSLIRELGLEPIYLKHDTESSDDRRIGLYTATRIASQEGKILVVDECEDFIQRSSGFSLGSKKDDSKSWINMYMDSTENARVIWLSNRVSLDESTARRFNYIKEFKALSFEQRLHIWSNVIEKHGQQWLLELPQLNKLIRQYDIDAGSINDALLRLSSFGEKDFHFLEHYLEQKMTFLKGGKPKYNTLKSEYSLEALNTSTPPKEIVSSLKKFEERRDHLKNFSLLLAGPPGTGKSEFPKFLSQELDRELLIVSVSDILSKWVGEAEQNLKKYFERAEAEDKILVLEEADSYFQPREGAQRSHEIQLVNELLVRMENFCGILICTLNTLNIEKAALRRFTARINFNYLNDTGKALLFENYFPHLTYEDDLCTFTNLTPGDYKNVATRLSYRDSYTREELIKEFREEVSYKQSKREIGLSL